ncbi:hypothetical protein [Desulfoplanes formicivorans]|uniref:Uncharacterized protein n=1 Tax=Desulfoplanes formicivorans TaxID=1592317 RepID=A0A194AH76_9BACT|nr:hypothetical protein [Desulfoplanes formicivorans]GAU08114.1 hypothetical protein DPF_0817 [Desulfoplanes formicivorans]
MTITAGMDELRGVLMGLSEGGKREVSHAMLYEVFGLDDEREKVRLRRRMQDMVGHGEAERVSPGVYRYIPKATPRRHGESYIRVWRAVRSHRPGWSFHDLSQVTRVSYSMVRRYCVFLEEEGYIERYGRSGNTLKYRGTMRAREQRATPYPPIKHADPFEAEKAAALGLVRVFLTMDPYSEKARAKVMEHCQTLVDRFGEASNG